MFLQGGTRFSGPISSTRTALIRDLFSSGFPRKFGAEPYGSYDKYIPPLAIAIFNCNLQEFQTNFESVKTDLKCRHKILPSKEGRRSREKQVASNDWIFLGPTFGRKMMKGYLDMKAKGIFASGRRGRGSLSRVASFTITIALPSPKRYWSSKNWHSYIAQYPGHKLHMDPYENLATYGVTITDVNVEATSNIEASLSAFICWRFIFFSTWLLPSPCTKFVHARIRHFVLVLNDFSTPLSSRQASPRPSLSDRKCWHSSD